MTLPAIPEPAPVLEPEVVESQPDSWHDEVRIDQPFEGMATMIVNGQEIILRGVTHGELDRFTRAAAEIEKRFGTVNLDGTESTDERFNVLGDLRAEVYGWFADVVSTLGKGAALPPRDVCPARPTSTKVMGELIQMWLGG